MRARLMAALVAAAAVPAAGLVPDAAAPVEVVRHDADRRVDVAIGGRPFTSFRYGSALHKPVLHPIRSAGGTTVTRGYPLEPRARERADHPHHVGHWFNFGDVNGFDFWGHSDETPPANRPRMGTIVHGTIVRAAGGTSAGTLEVTAAWVAANGRTLLDERTTFTFRGGGGWREVDRVTTWTARETVTFGDTKEGAFGIRVARALEHPSKEAATFVDAAGAKETVPALDNTGVNGEYLSSDGTRGEAVWGTRGPWMALEGEVDGEALTLAIFDHPRNHGFPTAWHARGYGLFAANPFGRHAFDEGQPVTAFRLAAGEALTFRHRIAVRSGRLPRERLQQLYDEWAR